MHYLYFIYGRKMYVRMYVKITHQQFIHCLFFINARKLNKRAYATKNYAPVEI